MFDKKQIHNRLKGVKGIGDVFNMINQGATEAEVEAKINELLEVHQLAQPDVVEYEDVKPYRIFGKPIINKNAIEDMDSIMRLPYVTYGALMPDAHRTREGSAPVGSVVVTRPGIIIPDLVSSDIACSVMLTEYNDTFREDDVKMLRFVLEDGFFFGRSFNNDPEWIDDTDLLGFDFPFLVSETGKAIEASVRAQARSQFGTCGDGNHFASFGFIHGTGNLALMTHFGSRGPGATIANAFSKFANSKFVTPTGQNAPLFTDTPEGQDYVNLMNWAGEFAEAGHRELARTQKEIRRQIYSRHNFAWKHDGGYIHRKGATPARAGQWGIIPATMVDPSPIVQGRGNEEALWSASHGGGRTHSRGRALQEFSSSFQDHVRREGVTLIGAGADEDPRAYKDIRKVMEYQSDCVSIIDYFVPVVVRMADARF